MPLSQAGSNRVQKMSVIEVPIVHPKQQNKIVKSTSGVFVLPQPEQSPKSECIFF